MEPAEHERDSCGINAINAVLHRARVVGSASLVGVRVIICAMLVICWLSVGYLLFE